MEKQAGPIDSAIDEAERALGEGDITVASRLSQGSNAAFLVHLDTGPSSYVRAVYKPRDGERLLYDFPEGTLYTREYASFLISRTLGWPNIPTTTIRDGPYGPGSIQFFVDHDPTVTYFDLIGNRRDELHKIAVFDALVNNADRKASHCLLDATDVIWSIDHGLTMHSCFKIRTVMLELWGRPYPDELIKDLESLAIGLENKNYLEAELTQFLNNREITSLQRRLEILINHKGLSSLDPYRNVPWPIL